MEISAAVKGFIRGFSRKLTEVIPVHGFHPEQLKITQQGRYIRIEGHEDDGDILGHKFAAVEEIPEGASVREIKHRNGCIVIEYDYGETERAYSPGFSMEWRVKSGPTVS